MDDNVPDDTLVDDGVVLPVVEAVDGNDVEDLCGMLNVTDGLEDMSVNDLTRCIICGGGCAPLDINQSRIWR
jgi:hypothetical protein